MINKEGDTNLYCPQCFSPVVAKVNGTYKCVCNKEGKVAELLTHPQKEMQKLLGKLPFD